VHAERERNIFREEHNYYITAMAFHDTLSLYIRHTRSYDSTLNDIIYVYIYYVVDGARLGDDDDILYIIYIYMCMYIMLSVLA